MPELVFSFIFIFQMAKKAAEEKKRMQAGQAEFVPTPREAAAAAAAAPTAAAVSEKPKVEIPAEAPKGPTFSVHPKFKKKSQ